MTIINEFRTNFVTPKSKYADILKLARISFLLMLTHEIPVVKISGLWRCRFNWSWFNSIRLVITKNKVISNLSYSSTGFDTDKLPEVETTLLYWLKYDSHTIGYNVVLIRQVAFCEQCEYDIQCSRWKHWKILVFLI